MPGSYPSTSPGSWNFCTGLDCERLTFTTSYPQAAAFGDMHFVCAGTPPRSDSDHADLSQVRF
jgi:UDPglucose 6-dehydrogenase